ncbi:recombination protein RecR [Candidatus Dojkabacteria bacterium]|nr:recombination protein RecR [Candidatus Dojkabacteria bacterium]
MAVLPSCVRKVISEFEKLPGVGPKSAARMAYFFLRAPSERSVELAKALVQMKKDIVVCKTCFNVSDKNPCDICSDSSRNKHKVCVVEELLDVVAIEASGVYDGLYFVLGGVISPADGIGPENLRMGQLRNRIISYFDSASDNSDTELLEIIIATNPSLEGEATSSYIIDMLSSINEIDHSKIKISRLAMGLPTGADLEYADRLTIKRAIEGRTNA